MKISIITVTYNAEKYLKQCIDSVLGQTYNNVELIVVDGGSTDQTKKILSTYGARIDKWISEPDNGIYDAMNKGIKLATGDLIGILNSDDFFFDADVLNAIANAFNNDKSLDATIGNICFISKSDENRIIRKYSSEKWNTNQFSWGIMPPHPAFFCKKEIFRKYGLYKTDYKIAADYELLIRFLKVRGIKFLHLPIYTTKMRLGGASTKNVQSIIILNQEIKRACYENNISTNYIKLYSKYLKKVFEFR